LVVTAVVIHQRGPAAVPWLPACSFHRLTGLHCAGCGMTRAVHATLQGRLAEAFRYNPLGMILLPGFGVWLALRLPRWLRKGPPETRSLPAGAWPWWVIGLILTFWIVRNLPFHPFTLLAPP
jgi:hypothetical protein